MLRGRVVVHASAKKPQDDAGDAADVALHDRAIHLRRRAHPLLRAGRLVERPDTLKQALVSGIHDRFVRDLFGDP